MAEIEILKPLLERHGLRPDKSLGQHYLISSRVINAIVSSVPEGVSIFEVGPGPGVISLPLFELGRPMAAIEIDERAVAVLGDRLPSLKVICADVLKSNFKEIVEELPGPRWLVSNMPYNITGPLLTLFTKNSGLFAGQTLMMQREVAQKINAKPGDRSMGSISVYLQTRFEIKHLIHAPPGAFFPPPKVDSDVLIFTPIQNNLDEEENIWHEKVVRAGFVQPRKTLANNLGTLVGKAEAIDIVSELGLEPSIRPHQVELFQWLKLAKMSRAKSNEN